MMENKKVSEKKDSWLKVLLSYTEGSGQRLGISVILSVISIISGLMPYYCIYRGIDLYIRNLNQAPMQEILRWCLYALLFYIIKIVSFSASTWICVSRGRVGRSGVRGGLVSRGVLAGAGDHRDKHDQRKHECKNLFHDVSSIVCFSDARSLALCICIIADISKSPSQKSTLFF